MEKLDIREPTPAEAQQMWEDRQKAEHEHHRRLLVGAVDAERRRIIGLVLNRYARAKLKGLDGVAQQFDELATEIENS